MRTVPAALAALTLTLGLAGPALAHPRTELVPPLSVDPTHASTDNVGFVARFHEHFGSAGGTVVSNDSYLDADGNPQEFYLVTDGRGVFTYDISDPVAPVQLDMLVLTQATAGIDTSAQEDPSTDGKIVLVDGNPTMQGGSNTMHVISIEDPTDIKIVSNLGTTDHTWTCVTDVATGEGCAYAYGRSNKIVDLRDPSAPTLLGTGWKQTTGILGTGNGGGDYTHDMTEVRPGLVMSAGAQPILMDTTDPANPKALVHIGLLDHRSPYDTLHRGPRTWSSLGYHSVEWARQGQDGLIVMGTELGGTASDCSSDQAVIETWDARPVVEALARYDALIAAGSDRNAARLAVFGPKAELVDFVRLDTYKAAERGIFLTGQSVGNENYCAHWMEPDRGWHDGGRLAAGYYERGARFIEVAPVGSTDAEGNDTTGKMTEIGWFTGADARTGSAQWITDEVVYVHDYRRGLDVLTITDEAATSTYSGTGSVFANAMTIAELDAFGLLPAPAPASSPSRLPFVLAAVALSAVALRRRALGTS